MNVDEREQSNGDNYVSGDMSGANRTNTGPIKRSGASITKTVPIKRKPERDDEPPIESLEPSSKRCKPSSSSFQVGVGEQKYNIGTGRVHKKSTNTFNALSAGPNVEDDDSTILGAIKYCGGKKGLVAQINAFGRKLKTHVRGIAHHRIDNIDAIQHESTAPTRRITVEFENTLFSYVDNWVINRTTYLEKLMTVDFKP